MGRLPNKGTASSAGTGDHLSSEIRQLTSERARLSHKLDTLSATEREERAELEANFNAQISEKSEALELLRARASDFENDVAKANQKIRSLTAHLVKEREANTSAAKEYESKYKDETAKFQAKFDKACEDRDAALLAQSETATSLKTAKDELERVNGELLSLKSRESTILTTELVANREHIANLEQERTDLKNRVFTLESKATLPLHEVQSSEDEHEHDTHVHANAHETTDNGGQLSRSRTMLNIQRMSSGETAVGAHQALQVELDYSRQRNRVNYGAHHTSLSNAEVLNGVGASPASLAGVQFSQPVGTYPPQNTHARTQPSTGHVPCLFPRAHDVSHFQRALNSGTQAERHHMGLDRNSLRAVLGQNRQPHTIAPMPDGSATAGQNTHENAHNRVSFHARRVVSSSALKPAISMLTENNARQANAMPSDTTVLEGSFTEGGFSVVEENGSRGCADVRLSNASANNSEISARLERLAELSDQLLKMSEDEYPRL